MRRVRGCRTAATFAKGTGKMRPKYFYVIADFRHSSDSGAGRLDGIFLFDGDCRRNPFNPIHLRLVHAVEELPSVGRKSLDIPALPFGEQSLKRQRAFAAPAYPGDHRHPVQRDVEVEILQVVLLNPVQSNGSISQ